MELRELAEQVLFATTLDEKLRAPGELTDERPGPPIMVPKMPGRPASLQFRSRDAARAEFPSVAELEQETERARLLHFFANHELLATELMALVLLRFPEAPAAFRRGVLQTLKDEQEHTRWYMDRMRESGMQFGDLPVSGYFWGAVSGMESPIDYVAGLSLTFEQANLDFAQHFAAVFSKVGDAKTAALLSQIHRDEIVHVAYGLKWFRRWKNPTESDWEAFCRHLKFPLSPQRAKGFSLNIEARRAAGLDSRFIAELDVYSRSKGRTPAVFVFNPFAEGYIAQGRSFSPVKQQALLALDLANLPQFLCRPDDIVLLARRPAVTFLSGLKRIGFALPEFIELKDGKIPPNSDLRGRKIGALRPWAWAPDSVDLLQPLFQSVTGETRHAQNRFNNRIAAFYSKTWSAELLREFLHAQPAADWLCDQSVVGVEARTAEAALGVVETIRNTGHHRVVVKRALGLAGQNAIRLWEPQVSAAQKRWIERSCEIGPVVVEPWLDRIIDFSVQLEMGSDGLKLCGYTGLVNEATGQFQANWVAPNFRQRLPDAVTRCFAAPPNVALKLHQHFDNLFQFLESRLKDADYLGPVGIDAFVYRSATGTPRLKPVVEINPRYTMGRVLVELMNRACPGTFGCFKIVRQNSVEAASTANPVVLEGDPVPRIQSGRVFLNDPDSANAYRAIFEITRTLDGLSMQIAGDLPPPNRDFTGGSFPRPT